ncbi:MAG: histidine phosphatase family protein [Pseudomonadales bacterium]
MSSEPDGLTLWLFRHAKSDWGSGAGSDHARPLNARGERDGPRMARWLADQDDPAAWIWTSDAARAMATAQFVAAGFAAAAPELVADRRLYLASPEQLLTVIRETPAEVRSAALVAHNPGLTQLLNLFSGRPVTDNLPTFGVARFAVPAPWCELRFGNGHLDVLTSPKRLPPTD